MNTIAKHVQWTVLAFSVAIALGAMLLSHGVAQAAELVVTDTVPSTPANWSSTLSVPKFDPSLGTLTKVEVTLSGAISGTAKYESTDPNPTTIALNLKADIQIQGPTGSLQVSPSIQKIDQAGPYDGQIDFGGPSGGTFPDLTASKSQVTTLTSSTDDLSPFIGTGTVVFSATAAGASSGSGSGNIITQFSVNAAATVPVKYTYVDARINLEKTVYAGHNSGASCPGSELVFGALNSPVTYCFVVTNPGDAYLNNMVIGDTDLGIISPTAPILLPAQSSGLPLAPLAVDPDARLVYYLPVSLREP